jgi:hypothetical protein
MDFGGVEEDDFIELSIFAGEASETGPGLDQAAAVRLGRQKGAESNPIARILVSA